MKMEQEGGKKTRKRCFCGYPGKEKVGIKIDSFRQKSRKVVKNCRFYEKNDDKIQECCRKVPVDKKM